MQLVVGQIFAKMPTRGHTGAKELIVRIIHTVGLEYGFQAALVERLVVRHKRQTLDFRLNLRPNVGKERRRVGVFVAQTVHLLAEPRVVVGLGPNERGERIDNLAAATTTPTLQTLEGEPFAVSKSIAAKSFIILGLSIRFISL